MPVQGTDFSKAISMAIRSYTEQSKKSRALIIISDGENHEPGTIEAAKYAKDNSVVIYTVGVGSTEGTPIPLQDGGFLKDREGNIVVTKLNENILQDMAYETGGVYVRATNMDFGLSRIIDSIHKMEKHEMKAIVFEEYREWFMYFLMVALFFLSGEILILNRRNKWLDSIDIFKRKNKKQYTNN